MKARWFTVSSQQRISTEGLNLCLEIIEFSLNMRLGITEINYRESLETTCTCTESLFF